MLSRPGWWFVLILAIAWLPAAARAGDWPQFRGPGGAGLADDAKLPGEWSADKNLQWKIKVPGVAWSAPIIWGDKMFVTTAVTDNQQKPRAGFGGGGGGGGGGFGRPKGPDKVYRFEVYCLDRATGKEIWKQLAQETKPRIPTHSSNTYATETPVTDGERVYAYFGMTGLFCFDFSGKLIWKKDLGSYSMMAGWGTASSPVLDGDRLFVQCDNEEKSFLVAFDKKTGDELWRMSRDEKSSWATPYVWRNKERTEIVAAGSKVRSYDPATGKVLWELSLGQGRASASPIGDDECLYVGMSGSSGRFGGGGGGGGGREAGAGPLYAVKAGAAGNITLDKGETSSKAIAWAQPKAGPSMASPLVYKGHIYVLERSGMLSCYDAKTGKPAYEKERLPAAKGFWASPFAGDGKVYCLDEDGQTFVLEAGPEFKLLGKNKLNDMFWSTPAAAGGALFLRGVDNLYCIK